MGVPVDTFPKSHIRLYHAHVVCAVLHQVRVFELLQNLDQARCLARKILVVCSGSVWVVVRVLCDGGLDHLSPLWDGCYKYVYPIQNKR